MKNKLFTVSAALLLVATYLVEAQTCGPSAGGLKCTGSYCCSMWGWCGSSELHCGAGCQNAFGSCNRNKELTPTPPVPTNSHFDDDDHSTPPVSDDYTCGTACGKRCPSGYCCSQYGWCGKSSAYCAVGCQPRFGLCSGSASVSLSLRPLSTNSAGAHSTPVHSSTNSAEAHSTPIHSSTNSAGDPFSSTLSRVSTNSAGAPSTSVRPLTTSVAPPTSSKRATTTLSPSTPTPTGGGGGGDGDDGIDLTLPISTNSTCGPAVGTRCPTGYCCSQYGWCGESADYCAAGCQPRFGLCSRSARTTTTITPPVGPTTTPTPGGRLPVTNTLFTKCVRPGMIAITLDDGPHANLDAFLQLFNSQGVKATFFFIGVNIAQLGSGPVRAAYNAGHQVAAHSYNHPSFPTLNSAEIQSEMSQTSSIISQAIGRTPNYFRYPYGDNNANTNAQITNLGFHKIQWSVDSQDWQSRNTQSIINEVNQGLGNSNPATDSHIMLFHEQYSQTVSALTTLIPQLRERGFRFVTVSECLGDSDAYV